jgi:cytochrome P450
VTIADDAVLPHLESPGKVGSLRLLKALRSDLLSAFDANAYSQLRVSFRVLGQRFVILNDPDDIDHVLKTHMDRYQPSVLATRLLEPIVGCGLVLAEGEIWRDQHRILVPAFQPRHVEQLLPTFHAAAAQCVSSWASHAVSERNLLVDFRRLTLAIIARSILSIDDEEETARLADFSSEYERTGALLRWQDYVAFFLRRNIAQPTARTDFRRRWRNWVGALIDLRPPVDAADDRQSLLDLMCAARDARGEPLPRGEIIDQIGTMLAAGFGTTSLALFWTAVMLALFPAHQEAVRSELCRGPIGIPPNSASLSGSKTTIAFLYEVLRLNPPAYIIAREARLPDRLGDFAIPSGAAVIIAPWLVHRHSANWRDPHQFDPMRFVHDGRVTTPKAWMAFGKGPRACIGSAFATMEIMVILRVLLAKFRIGLNGPMPRPTGRISLLPEFEPTFTLSPLA